MTHTKTARTISTLRDLRDISPEALGALAGCSGMTVRRIERGEQDPSVSVLARLLDALEADDRTRLGLLKVSK